ncbi:hypothetical protein M0R45_021742 [Rubus argutus]|uniref:Pentatricopeptide repeat-containing protein n=1 Tax=Rubus argutus TaxID=59490 RepID=A0AAW1XFS0_RUBAR
MRALAAVNDISGVERVVDEMKRDGRVASDWTTYSNLASIYVDAGMPEKAENVLSELEKKNSHRDLSAFQFLITLYGRTGNLLEVHRVWRSLRLAFPKTANISYLNMVQVLVNLKDLPGAEKCFREWASRCSTYDIRRFYRDFEEGYGSLRAEVFESLIRTYAAAGKKTPAMRHRLKMENVEVSEASKKLLEVICVE